MTATPSVWVAIGLAVEASLVFAGCGATTTTYVTPWLRVVERQAALDLPHTHPTYRTEKKTSSGWSTVSDSYMVVALDGDRHVLFRTPDYRLAIIGAGSTQPTSLPSCVGGAAVSPDRRQITCFGPFDRDSGLPDDEFRVRIFSDSGAPLAAHVVKRPVVDAEFASNAEHQTRFIGFLPSEGAVLFVDKHSPRPFRRGERSGLCRLFAVRAVAQELTILASTVAPVEADCDALEFWAAHLAGRYVLARGFEL